MSLQVCANERGLVRVFALSMSDAEALSLRENMSPEDDAMPAPQQAALGLTYLDSDFTEVFPIADLGELGLAGYLVEGNGIDPASLTQDRAKLDNLDGWVFLVYSSAFGGFNADLTPLKSLTLIGTYAEMGADWTPTQVLESDAAYGAVSPAKSGPSDAAMSGRVASLVLLVIFALTALVVWVAS